MREVGNIDNVNVAPGRRANGAWSLLTHERKTLRAVRGVVDPPDIVSVSAYRLHVTEENWIGDRSAFSSSADVEDRHAFRPERGHENSVAHEYVVDERISHHFHKHFNGRSGIGDVEDHQPRWVLSRIDRQKGVQ